MDRKLFGLCLITGAAFTGILLGGCHNQAADDAAQKKSIEGGMPTPAQMQEVNKRMEATRAAQQSTTQAATQHTPPK